MTDRDALLACVPPHLLPQTEDVATRRLEIAVTLLDRRLNGIAVVAEAVHRRHNVSAILRSAEGFGVHEGHLVTERFRPSVGSAKGAERWMDVALHEHIEGCVAGLKERGFALWIADLGEGSLPPWEVPVERPVALLIGSELTGVSDAARALADGVVTVPMHGVTQSLNASAAAAVVLNHVCERRRRVPGALGIEGEARVRFFERFLDRENRRKQASDFVWEREANP